MVEAVSGPLHASGVGESTSAEGHGDQAPTGWRAAAPDKALDAAQGRDPTRLAMDEDRLAGHFSETGSFETPPVTAVSAPASGEDPRQVFHRLGHAGAGGRQVGPRVDGVPVLGDEGANRPGEGDVQRRTDVDLRPCLP